MQNHDFIGPQRTPPNLPQWAEAEELFAVDCGRRHFPVWRDGGRAVPGFAAGPAGSDDQKLIQALAQTFARDRSPVRLSPITTEGTTEAIALFATSKADRAVARGDLNLPANAESVLILRKNVVVLWTPSGLPAKGSKKQPAPKIKSIDELAGHRVGVIGRTQANVTLLRVILTES